MNSNRLLLRAATVLALNRGGVGPFPTMAGEGVYDTKMAPVMDIAQQSHTPVCLVYTGTDRRENIGKGGQGVNWKRHIDLVVQIAIGSVTEKGSLSYIETDPEMEATLDLFELEVEAALMATDNPWSLQWRGMIRCIESWTSEPYRSAEQSARYAVREIAIEVELQQDCVVQFPRLEGDAIDGEPLSIGVPYLAPLEKVFEANPTVFGSTLALLKGERSRVTVPELKHIRLDQRHADGASVIADIKR